MKKGLNILFIFMLISQTMFTSVGFGTVVDAEGSKKNIKTDLSYEDNEGNIVDPEEYEGDISVVVEWSVEDIEEIEDGYKETIELSIPKQIILEEGQSDSLLSGETEVAEYNALLDGIVEVEFNEEFEALELEELEGTFTLRGEIEAEEVEETNEKEEEIPVEDEEELAEEEGAEGSGEPGIGDIDGSEAPDDSEDTKESETTEEGTELVQEEESSGDNTPKVTKRTIQVNDDGNGFNLNLGSVTDLNDEPYGEDNLLDPHDEFQLTLDWDLTDAHGYKEGDKETFDLPKGIKITQEITGELIDDISGAVVATYTITPDKKVKLTFTDFVETHSNVKGWLQIISTLDEKEVEVEDGEAILDPIGEEGALRIPIEQGNKDKTIEKNGTPNKNYNANEINWAVTINKNKTSLTDAKVTDLLPEGTEYKEGSLVVTKLKVDLYGNILGDEEVVDITGETVTDGTLTIPLGNIHDAYRVEYVTTVTDDEQKEFKNNAILSDDELEDVPANATITINRGEAIKKKAAKGYDPKTGIIEWEIEFNYNEKSLEEVTLTDAWTPAGKLDLVEDSLVFTEVEIDENGNAQETGNVGLPEGAELVPGDDGFEVTGITTDKSYKVTYQTKVKDRVLDPLEVANTAGFGSESTGSGTGIGTYYGSKSAGTIDYVAKTIDWKIEMNHDEYPMEQISIVDTLGEGLTLLEETIEITVDGNAYEGDYNLSGDNPFIIDFPEDFITDKKIEISYKTEFDADNVPDHKPTNKADITWTPEGGDESITKDVKTGTELNEATKESSWKNGSYDPTTKEITWEIITNYRNNSIADLNITDAPQGNQKIVLDSVKVHELTIDGNGNHRPGDDVTANVDVFYNEDNTISVDIGETEKAYYIEYKTSLEGLSDIQSEYVNEAEVLDGTEKLADLDAKVGIAKSDTYGEKSGYQEGKQVHWSVNVNLGQQKISDLKLEDTISENQDYLVDSIKVYQATVDGNGNASKGEEVTADQYEITHTPGEQEFSVEWNQTVEHAFVVEYSTLFFERHGQDVTNTYKVTGDSILEEDSNSEGGSNVTISQLSSGGGSGEAGYLVINKIGKKDGVEAPLAGAEFDLIDPDNGSVLKSGTTDEEGQIDFGRLLFGDYELYERVVPEGYVTKEERQTIVIDKKYHPDDEKESFAYEVLNFEPVFAIELSKTDNDNNALVGAEFTLFDSEDNEVATETTDEDGKILFEDLKNAGTYYVQETKAPEGFVLNIDRHYVEIGEKESEPVKVSVQNTPRGAVLLTKTDKDTNEVLEGVEFELQKKNDSREYEAVKTFTTDEKGQIKTSNTLEAGDYQFVEVKGLDGYRTNEEAITFTVDVNEANSQTFSMTNEKFKGSVKLIKLDAATEDLLDGATFKLVDSEGEVVEEGLITNDQGEIVVDNLLLGNYQLIETVAPEGYELDETPIDVEITEDGQVIEKTMENNRITNITVEKQWNNGDGETVPVTVQLLPTDQTVELNEDNDWKATFNDLQVYDELGGKINYEVKEVEVDGYTSTVTGDPETGFIVTNTELTTVSGEKIWLDDLDEHPAIVVELLANDTKIDEIEVNEVSNWAYEFTELEKYDELGEEITYTVDEVEVEGYETIIDDFDITNLRVGTTELSGEKIWLDDESEGRPDSITVNLLANEVETDSTVEVTSETDWKYEFTDLDKYDEEGLEITYTVDEEEVPEGYEKAIKDNDITNLRIGTTEVEVTKLWQDEDENDRPETITINLLQNGDFYEEHEVTKENDWELTITDLPQYDEEGKAYEYTITEHDVAGYEAEVDEFEITNTRTDVKEIEINKSWLDNDSEDRPNSIEVELFRSITDGDLELVDTYTVTAENDWSLEVPDLPTFNNDGKAYTYELKEKAVDGYKTTINGFDITNLRVGETEVEGTKIWLDDNSEERPDSITVNLLANGEVVDTDNVTAASNWEYEFTGLPKYNDQGVEITYTVDEEEVPEGYEKAIKDNDITNLRVGTTEVTGVKTWVEVDERYRPDSITVNLHANGDDEAVESREVTANEKGEWTFTFVDLAKYDKNGEAIAYTVVEDDVPGYNSEVDGTNITNTQETTEVSGTKTWKDNDSEDRPDSITVQVMNGDEVVKKLEVTKEDDWNFTFTDLAKYDAEGKEIKYTINELPVPGYETAIEGTDITNTRADKVDVEGTKTWKGDSSSDRPKSITVELLANGEKEDSIEVTADNDWTYQFTKLPAYDENGVAIAYSVDEVAVDSYEATINGYDITNTFIEEPEEQGKDPKDPTKPEEDPKDSKPGVDPKDPGKPGVDPKDPGQTGDTTEAGKEGSLPDTATNTFNMMLIGGLLLLLGTGFIMFRRKKA